MNKSIFFFVAMLFVTLHAMAQQDSIKTDETPKAAQEENQVTISATYFSKLQAYEEKYRSLEREHSSLKEKYDSIVGIHRKETEEIANLSKQNNEAGNRINSFREDAERANKRLINMACYFLYIPYETSYIEKIAIPAFDGVTNQELKDKYIADYNLLKSYRQHIEELRNFLVETDETLESLAGPAEAKNVIEKLKQQGFYIKYKELDEKKRSVTYLGKKIIEIERQLKAFDGGKHKLNVKGIIAELNACLKTQENL